MKIVKETETTTIIYNADDTIKSKEKVIIKETTDTDSWGDTKKDTVYRELPYYPPSTLDPYYKDIKVT